MDVIFQKDYLSDLYYAGKTSDKQHRYQPEVVRKYAKVVGLLEAVSRMEDLYRFNSLHFEALEGPEPLFLVRIDIHYRLVFQMASKAGETVFAICKLEDITNHYKA
ncbi:MAG: type II toxin-antitoxin system RelE/ParE family toxin [Paludibacteraceae bacterium]|nr:type II toxin-antitoxin system RelE/ParE family toxin [Paludibacteraceae bacterium]